MSIESFLKDSNCYVEYMSHKQRKIRSDENHEGKVKDLESRSWRLKAVKNQFYHRKREQLILLILIRKYTERHRNTYEFKINYLGKSWPSSINRSF